MRPESSGLGLACLGLAALACCLAPTGAFLIQPYNYMLDDAAHLDDAAPADPGSLAPFHHEQHDGDVASIISEQLAQLRLARMLHQNQQDAQRDDETGSQLSAEASELASEQQEREGAAGPAAFSNAVASMLLNVASAREAAASSSGEQPAQAAPTSGAEERQQGSAGHKSEPQVSKSGQWFNPKEHIPVLKISSMATPSKYKKVYFRSEKKLVDGAFHSPGSEQEEKKSLIKSPFNSKVQRRSSRGTSSSAAPPSPLQDGVIDFLRKFRDVYVQTRPAGSGAGLMSAAASSPLASVLSPAPAGRPNLASAISAASSLVAQAAASPVGQSTSGAAATASAAVAAGAAKPTKPLVDASNYVSFWSKTFPNWVRKMLKQMRRRSLQNHSKRQQAALQHSGASVLGQAAQAAASGAVASAIEAATGAGQSANAPASPSSSSSSSSGAQPSTDSN